MYHLISELRAADEPLYYGICGDPVCVLCGMCAYTWVGERSDSVSICVWKYACVCSVCERARACVLSKCLTAPYKALC